MKGKLTKTNDEWIVKYPKYPLSSKINDTATLPLHPYNVAEIKAGAERFDNLEARIIAWPDVEFDIVDEFNNPELFRGIGWGDGIKYAKLK